jgi:glycosyltransferase involved in cell wall biosynthesis
VRIAQVCSYFDPHVGGVETHVRELARALARRGHEVTVVAADSDGSPLQADFGGLKVVRVPPRTTWFNSPSMPGAEEVLAGGGFDLVHSHSPPPLASWRASRAARRAEVPHVMTFHCDPEIPGAFGRVVVEAWRLTLGRATLRRTDHLISTTASYASTSRTIWNYSPTVIPNAVDPAFFRPGPAAPRVAAKLPGTSGFRLLYVGRLVEHKGLEQVIDAMAFLKPPAQLMIAGSGPLQAALEARAAASPAKDRIKLLGRVPLEDLPEVYRACDVFALPSVSRLEAFGIVALEAMASGLPVVASDIPGVREVVTEGTEGYLANPLDPQSFASRIDAVLQDPLAGARMGRNGRARVLKEFTWERVAERVEQVYNDVLGRSPKSAPAASSPAAPA